MRNLNVVLAAKQAQERKWRNRREFWLCIFGCLLCVAAAVFLIHFILSAEQTEATRLMLGIFR